MLSLLFFRNVRLNHSCTVELGPGAIVRLIIEKGSLPYTAITELAKNRLRRSNTFEPADFWKS